MSRAIKRKAEKEAYKQVISAHEANNFVGNLDTIEIGTLSQ